MLGALAPHAMKLRYLIGNNSSAILTGVGVAGTAATAVLTGHASFKAVRVLDEAQVAKADHIMEQLTDDESRHPQQAQVVRDGVKLSKTEKIANVWPLYLPPVAVGVTTIASIIVAHRIDAKKIAALAIATGVSERALQEYKDKVVEKFTPRQATAVQDEIVQDRVNQNPPSQQPVIIGTGDVLCFDAMSGRYFHSSMEQIKQAEAETVLEIAKFDCANLSFFYDQLSWPQTTLSSLLGWNIDHPMEIEYSMVMSEDNRPCIGVDFRRKPIMGYDK